MTYRRVFLWLLLGSTLMTAVAWVHWRRPSRVAYFNLAAVPFTMLARVKQGTITMEWHSEKYLPPRFIYDSIRNDSASRWTGRFRYEWVDARPPTAPPCTMIRVDFPVWLPWLIFNAGVFALCWWLQRRAAVKMRKLLAVQESERDAGPQ